MKEGSHFHKDHINVLLLILALAQSEDSWFTAQADTGRKLGTAQAHNDHRLGRVQAHNDRRLDMAQAHNNLRLGKVQAHDDHKQSAPQDQ